MTLPSEQAISQRAHPRRALKAPAAIVPVDERGEPGAEHRCHTLDLSRGGVGLVSPRLVCPGQRCLVVIEGGACPGAVFGTVRHVRYVPGRGHVMGLEFGPMPSTPQVASWLEARGVGVVAGSLPVS